MAYPAPVESALDNLDDRYNGNVMTPANPGGMDGDGHTVNFIPALRDVATVGRGVADLAENTIAALQARLDEHATLLDRLTAATAAAANGPVITVNGMGGVVVLPDVPKVLPPIVTQPVAGSTPSLTGGALVLSVDRLTSLYGEAQKTIRFQIATAASFAANTIVFDSNVLAQAAVSASLANAQATLAGGTTYYVRAIQTDAKDVSSGWSAPVSFVFPRLPNAPVMSAPANGATDVAAQNVSVVFTASAYSHPNGVARASRSFQVSNDDFATALTYQATGDSYTLDTPQSALTADTAYKVRARDVDVNGGVSTGAATTFRTTATYSVAEGTARDGGFLAFKNYGVGYLEDLIVAPKSTIASRSYSAPGQASQRYAGSLLDGRRNTLLHRFAEGTSDTNNDAFDYAVVGTFGGVGGYLPAQYELQCALARIGPSKSSTPAFASGGSEAFVGAFLSSTESPTSPVGSAILVSSDATLNEQSKANNVKPVRAFKRVRATMPFALGTAMEGGYLSCYITYWNNGTPITYMIIVSDATTERQGAWGGGTSIYTDRINGFLITAAQVQSAGSQAAASYHADQLNSGGKTDWFLPSIDEALVMATVGDQLPSGQKLPSVMWTCTEVDANTVRYLSNTSTSPVEGVTAKTNTCNGRAVRRVLLPAGY